MTNWKTGIENRKKELKEFLHWIIDSKKRVGAALAIIFFIVVGIAAYVDPSPEPPNYSAAKYVLLDSNETTTPLVKRMNETESAYWVEDPKSAKLRAEATTKEALLNGLQERMESELLDEYYPGWRD